MSAFVARRAVQMVASLWAALTLVFVAVTLLPGDPVRGLFGDRPPPEEVYDAVTAQYHLDEPLPVQYLLWVGDVVTGDLGRGFPVDAWGDPGGGPEVSAVVATTAPVSAVVLLGALVVQSVVGVVAGALAAGSRRGGVGVYAVALLLVGTPVLVAASALRVVFGSSSAGCRSPGGRGRRTPTCSPCWPWRRCRPVTSPW
ncbi:ABC transporter permease family protein [Geodermatophilus marinus]|uniref:ABC transporter permease n=1 Tax=Geodermatophilus sp. LHW52908 TaxID=2303986 RepID=UPI000E3BB6CA|nr:ABC transporter permease [Geodermatophilus sp. LHW52908]RFU20743.1 ABC transporter permease [Geodermatophilus sp. LHW52908]